MPSPSLGALSGFEQRLVVGVGDFAVSNNQSMQITTYSLGSCIGLTIYDPVRRVGGLLHLMLPDSSINPQKAVNQPAMFADSGIPALFRAAYELLADKHRVQICVAGGAQVMDASGTFNIGIRNYKRVAEILDQHSLRIVAEQVGGMVSRTMMLNNQTGEVRLKVSGQPTDVILWRGN